MGKMARWLLATGILIVLIVGVFSTVARTQAQSTASSNTSSDTASSGGSATETYRAKLQSQLDQLEKQIADQQAVLDQSKNQEQSLSRDIKILTTQISQAKLEIKARDINIAQLQSGITGKKQTITGLNAQQQSELDSLSAILREKDQLDVTSPAIAVLSSDNISNFFSDLDRFDEINTGLQASFAKISNIKDITQQQEDDLQSQLDQENQLREVQQLQEQQIQSQQNQKNKLLADTKGQEKNYQTVIAANQKSAAQIRAALFQLNGTSAISFGKALDYANEASKATGIRPAFLLGIIKEESDLGTNVGTGSYTVDMNPTRDVPVFIALVRALGLDPASMPVSKKQWYGWGGAMGPAQFIPSTWAQFAGYVKPDYHYDQSKDRVGRKTGNTPPNPWNPEDAFMAAALYLTDDGAAAQTASGEFKAAMCYLAGCGNAGKSSLQFYGQNVAQYAAEFQCQIDIINGKSSSAVC
jgi:hypothetical protein